MPLRMPGQEIYHVVSCGPAGEANSGAPKLVTNWTKPSGHATMGSMSASDAAPLPRLGEGFFDVRGSSRSMRLSWYSDTGIAVFSIWQGGTCTGTFRLPIEELPRLIGALQRGPADVRGSGDPYGNAGMPRQLPGAPTDPRLRVVPGYSGPREADFSGPATGDFRALRPDDPSGLPGYGAVNGTGGYGAANGGGAYSATSGYGPANGYGTANGGGAYGAANGYGATNGYGAASGGGAYGAASGAGGHGGTGSYAVVNGGAGAPTGASP